ncbi:MAG: ATP-binding protein [Acidobacteria bacterium]|nr:ATP-binding protein [Acidobacteriota bacterium]
MDTAEVPRPDLAGALLARARQGSPLVLTGPPGSGKTTLLLAAREALEGDGWVAVYLDLMGAASSPDRFVLAALDALPASSFGSRLPEALEIRTLASAGKAHGAAAVRALLALWASLGDAGGRPVALLLDEPTEIRSLAYFAGLREVDAPFGAALAARRRGTLLATSFPTLARRLWPAFETLAARPLTEADLKPALAAARTRADAAALVRASFGWARYVRVLLERVVAGDDLVAAWADEMAAGGRVELMCRSTYETLLLRSRGYGMSKAALAAVAREEGLNLTALVPRLGRTPGATRDYLQWLVGVDALRMVHKSYVYVDGMVRAWVRLHARGTPPTREDLLAAAREAATGAPAAGRSEAAEPPVAAAPGRRESLMEID